MTGSGDASEVAGLCVGGAYRKSPITLLTGIKLTHKCKKKISNNIGLNKWKFNIFL